MQQATERSCLLAGAIETRENRINDIGISGIDSLVAESGSGTHSCWCGVESRHGRLARLPELNMTIHTR
jgi:hypothetical protein